MKRFVFLIASLLLSAGLFGQTIEYFTSDWKKTKNKDKAAYYRVVTYDRNGQPVGLVKDYYKDGQLQWAGYLLSIGKNGEETRQGWCTWYYENGKPQQLSFYAQGYLDSTTYYWNENGDLTGEEDYRNNRLHGAWIRYYPGKKPHYVAAYANGLLKNNVYLEYDEAGNVTVVYPEYFDNTSEWILSRGQDYAAEIKDKKLWLTTQSANWRIFGYKHVPLDAAGNFSIETIVTPDQGTNEFKSHGLVWGLKDVDNYDYFIISNQGSFQTGYYQKGVQIPTLQWTNSAAIRQGAAPNQLKVIKAGNQYIFAVNGQAVATAAFQQLMGNYAGITIASGAERIYVNRFLVQQEAGRVQAENNSPATGAIEWNASGSGILIDKNGFIATNHHVIKGAQAIEVEFTKNGRQYAFSAEVIKADAEQDIAILRINDPHYNAFKPSSLPFGITTNLLDIGTSVFALGYPEMWTLGKNIKFTDGKISAQTGAQDNPYWYQISVPIQHGNSGGPLFDNDGNLVGLTNAGWVGKLDNVAYAIKSSQLMQLLLNSFPGQYVPPTNTIKAKPLTEKIKLLEAFVPLIKVKL